MAIEKKDTIYIDVDDEITAVIDKLTKSDSKIVALVLPKRMTALQSIVNMKLLKRAAKEAGKSPVLITSEKSLLPLAGATGLYVAKNLSSKPEVPAPPDTKVTNDEELVEDMDKTAAAGVIAGAAVADEAIDMETEPEAPTQPNSSNKKPNKAKSSKSKSTKIPNFEKFRKKIFIIGGALLAAIILFILAVVVLPKATITIQTDTETVNSSFEFIASPSTNQVDESAKVVPAKVVTSKKEDSQTAAATGQKDLGAKASGNMTFSIPCSSVSGTPPTIPAGTGVSTNGLTYITQNDSSLTTPSFEGGCVFTGTTTVNAQNNGEQYNIGPATYKVSGFNNVTGNGSQMSGGSSKIARVVTSQDVDAAKAKLANNDEAVKQELQKQLESSGLFVIDSSFTKNEKVTVSPEVDQEASEVKVTKTTDYSMVGVDRDSLKTLIQDNVKGSIDPQRQKVQDDGLDQATFTVKSTDGNGDVRIAISTRPAIGPEIDSEALKQSVAGKKSGDTENIVKQLPGVKDVKVSYSPFWVSSTPKKTSKITINFESAN